MRHLSSIPTFSKVTVYRAKYKIRGRNAAAEVRDRSTRVVARVTFNEIIWRIARASRRVLKPLTISLVNHVDDW